MKNTITAPIKEVVSKITLLFAVLLVLAGCGSILNAPTYNNMTDAEKNSEIVGEEKDEIVGKVSQTIFDTVDRNNSKGQNIETGEIEKSGMEVNVPEGRYEIFAGEAGNVFIYDEQGDLLIREMFDRFYGVDSSLTVDLSENHTIFFDGGLEGATVRHAETKLSNSLSPGIWEVGLDINAGNYIVTTDDRLVGYLQVFDPGKEVRVYELVGGGSLQTKSDVQLVEGQKLKITGTKQVHFEPVGK
ncbi:hypothetical protein [Sporosarcina jiandibaonis]|uniref:hypothetical protein n=1 Tax=Sporosarcina jiandibaonis TaxID=2715535 RepID=UPI0015526062|nr:hypothetical protein [Sporosarcina jiandibaonis]